MAHIRAQLRNRVLTVRLPVRLLTSLPARLLTSLPARLLASWPVYLPVSLLASWLVHFLAPSLAHAQMANAQAVVQQEAAAGGAQVSLGAWHAIVSASWPVQLTLLILVLMSILSWGIVFCKKKQLDQIKKSNKAFLNDFWQASSLESVFQSSSSYVHSTVARLFQKSYVELNKLKRTHSNPQQINETSLKETLASIPLSMEYLERSLHKEIDTELPALESHLNFLATTGSTAPFIGLFGTVWGIMGAFQKIAQSNSASLAVVAPGIAEALIATAIGLAVAIPATVAYNHFIAHIRCEELELHNFAGDFLNLTKRNICALTSTEEL